MVLSKALSLKISKSPLLTPFGFHRLPGLLMLAEDGDVGAFRGDVYLADGDVALGEIDAVIVLHVTGERYGEGDVEGLGLLAFGRVDLGGGELVAPGVHIRGVGDIRGGDVLHAAAAWQLRGVRLIERAGRRECGAEEEACEE